MLVSIIAPCYNEADTLEEFYSRLIAVAASQPESLFEFIFVNDGSHDATALLLDGYADADPRVKILHLARNMGHQIAITAGIDFAAGDMIITMDADLQDPPEMIPSLLHKLAEGFDVVHAQRRTRPGETAFKRATARAFYKFLRWTSNEPLVEGCGDFRAFTRPVLLSIQSFREPHRYLRGLFFSLGYRQAVVQYDRASRTGGVTKFSLRKMMTFGLDGLISFSSALLRSMLWLAVIFWGISLVFLVRAVIGHFVFNRTAPGWTSLVVLLTFFTGLNLFCLSVIGIYVGRIFEQGQHRPLYWCRSMRNITITPASFSNITREMLLSSNITTVSQPGHTAGKIIDGQ